MSQSLNEIEILRQKIEILHQDFFKIICDRQDLVCQIWDLKKKSNLAMIDHQREELLIHQFDESTVLKNDENFKEMYHNIVKNIMTETKKYLSQQPK